MQVYSYLCIVKLLTRVNNMKRFFTSLIVVLASLPMLAQGWPSHYEGVMLQGFYWDSYSQSQWTKLEEQADELSGYFTLVWLPQSANCGGQSMGYDDLYWFPGHYNSSFGTEGELRSLIHTFKQKGIGTIADVVINHRKNVSNWVDFPAETYNGVTYQLKSTDICADDDDGATKTWATKNGYQLSSNNDTGTGWGGMRDLDHKSSNVQTNVKAYLKMLLSNLGYVGFRYDMVKGYSGLFTKLYNEDAKPQFSVGECWDGTSTIKSWIDATGKTSAAFDFQFRYTVRNAANNGNWVRLGEQNEGNWPLVSSNTNSGAYRRYAVTFVENHDTEKRSNAAQDPLKKDTLAANAYMLAMNGTPCVFMTHWIDCKRDLKSMIDVRRAVGIHNESETQPLASTQNYYAVRTTGTTGMLVAVVGNQAAVYTPAGAFTRVLSGYHYAYWMSNAMETAWVDLASGEYEGKQQAMLTAVSTNSGAQLVYTTDGSTPTAQSTRVASGTKINVEGSMTLKVGLLIGGVVSGVVTRVYTQPKGLDPAICVVNEGEVCAFFESPAEWKNDVCCWAWTDTPSDNFTYATGGWPGVTCRLLGAAENGNKVWKWTWAGTKQNNSAATQPAKIIFSNSGQPQTADLVFQNGGYYNKDGFQKLITAGIHAVKATPVLSLLPVRVTTADGRLLRLMPAGTTTEAALSGLPHGLYIVNKVKVVK